MKTSALVLVVLLSATATGVFGQSGYFTDQIQYSDSVNLLCLPEGHDNLSVTLVRAYLEGKIRGYEFKVKEDVLKWRPLPLEYYPKPWNPKEYYFLGDEVTYKGKFYSMDQEIRPSPITPDKGNHWKHFERDGGAATTVRNFPSIKDTLSKAQFLSNMIIRASYNDYSSWQPSYEYYAGDWVEYSDSVYSAIADNRNIKPSDRNYWRRGIRSPTFGALNKYSSVSILSHYEATASDTTWSPQMLTVGAYDSNAGYSKEVISFQYCDVISYLESLRQPLAFFSTYGYLGDSIFLMDEGRMPFLVKWIHRKINEGAINNVAVEQSERYKEFLSLQPKILADPVANGYTLSQQLSGKNMLLIFKGNVIATIPVKTVLGIPEVVKRGSLYPLSAALNEKMLNHYHSPDRFDSLTPLKACQRSVPKSITRFSFLDEYQLTYRNAHERMMLSRAWHHLLVEMKNGKLKSVESQKFNYLSYPWSKEFKKLKDIRNETSDAYVSNEMGGTYEMYPDHEPNIRIDSIRIGLSIIYEKMFYNDVFSFRPKTVVLYQGPNGYFDKIGSFPWPSAKESLLRMGYSKFADAITMIEKGIVSLGGSTVVRGLVEEK